MKKFVFLVVFTILSLGTALADNELENVCKELTSECPIDCGNGIVMTKMNILGDYLVYHYSAPDDQVKMIKENKNWYKNQLKSTIQNPSTIPFIELVVKEGKGVCFRIKGNKSGDYVDVVFSNSEVKNLIR